MSKKRLFRDHVDNRGERHQTKGLMSWTIALHVGFLVIVFPCKTTLWNDQMLCSLRNVNNNCKILVNSFWRCMFSLHDILPKVVSKPFVCHRQPRFFCCFLKTRECENAWRHYSGLLRVFCSLDQNVWNTFQVFWNWNSVSIERLFGFIPFLLIPE